MKIILFFLLFVTAPFSAWSQNSYSEQSKALQLANDKKIAEHAQWLNLLNYRRDFYWLDRGQADSPGFYLGDIWNPQAELEANIKAIFDPQFSRTTMDGKYQEKYPCVFPGRFMWLKKQLPEVQWPQVTCTRFENYRDILNAKSVTYVFSSYFLNNPSSAFGHTFLRLNREGNGSQNGSRHELIDFGVGYTAIPTTSNPALYAIMGFAGFFPGRFETHPYYYKVREYNDFENRDLWEYDLNLTQEEVDFLVAHIFELDVGGFDYVYLTENCAYRILAALDTVRPSLHLIDRTKGEVMPGDTVALIFETPGLVKDIHYRPSGRSIFFARLETLSLAEKEKFNKFALDLNLEELIFGTTEKEKMHLLDAAIDYLDFKFADEILNKRGYFVLKKRVLAERSQVVLTTPDLLVTKPELEAPHLAHGSARWSLGYLQSPSRGGYLISHRFALHDLLDPHLGYSAFSEIEMGNISFFWNQNFRRTLELDNFTVVKITSLSDWNQYNQTVSWNLQFGAKRADVIDCERCLVPYISGGVGAGKQFQKLFMSAWLKTQASYSSEYLQEKYLIGVGPALIAKYSVSAFWSFLAEVGYRYDYKSVNTDHKLFSFSSQYSFDKSSALRWTLVSDRKEQAQHLLEFNWYY